MPAARGGGSAFAGAGPGTSLDMDELNEMGGARGKMPSGVDEAEIGTLSQEELRQKLRLEAKAREVSPRTTRQLVMCWPLRRPRADPGTAASIRRLRPSVQS